MVSSKPRHLRKAHIQLPSQWGLGFQLMNVGGGHNSGACVGRPNPFSIRIPAIMGQLVPLCPVD